MQRQRHGASERDRQTEAKTAGVREIEMRYHT